MNLMMPSCGRMKANEGGEESNLPCDLPLLRSYSWVDSAVSFWSCLSCSMVSFSSWISSKYFWRALSDSEELTPVK